MKTRLLALVLALSLPSVAMAVGVEKHAQSGVITLLALSDCADSAADRRFTLTNFAGFALTGVQVNFTYNAATAVAMSCEASLDNGTTWATLQSCSVSGGVCTSTDASWSNAIAAASENFFWRIDALAAPRLRCTFSCTGGGASDTFTVYGVVSAE